MQGQKYGIYRNSDYKIRKNNHCAMESSGKTWRCFQKYKKWKF